jgi:hypothetical protein
MKSANLRRLFGTRLFIWQPTGYFVIGILDRVGPGYTVIKAFKSDRPISVRPRLALGRYEYADIERDELTLEARE